MPTVNIPNMRGAQIDFTKKCPRCSMVMCQSWMCADHIRRISAKGANKRQRTEK